MRYYTIWPCPLVLVESVLIKPALSEIINDERLGMESSVAFISKGYIHLATGGQNKTTIESQFAQQVRQRSLELQQRHGWKGGRSSGMVSSQMLWGVRGDETNRMQVNLTGLCRGRSRGEVFYTLNTGEVSGIFLIRQETGQEIRLLHSADYKMHNVAVRAGHNDIACAVRNANGIANLAVMVDDNSGLAEVTEGDSIDLAPSWMTGPARQLVFQSAGIARDASGYVRGRGPYSIQKLDLDTGEITNLAEDSKYDLLSPKADGAGSLYYIRRPYKRPGERPKWWRLFIDIPMMPLRLLYAAFQYLNWFTVSYTGRMLTDAGTAKQKEIDAQRKKVLASLFDAETANRDELLNATDQPGLVANSWQLMKQAGNSKAEPIAGGVLSFDICQDGSIVYSNGSEIFHSPLGSPAVRIAADDFIEQVASVDMA